MQGPLAGLSILEASGDVAVRYCGRLFRQLGALVVSAIVPDDRRIGHGGAAGEAYGRWLDQGKVRGSEQDLAGPFDLVIAGQEPAAVAAAAARFEAPLLAITWFAASGPYAAWRGCDEVITALCGVAYSFGEVAGPPILAQGHGPQLTAAVTAFDAALGALLAPADARPRRIAVSILEAAICFMETAALGTRVEGTAVHRLGVNRYVPTFPNCSLRTADGWVGLTALTPAQWRGLCELIGRPDLAQDPRFDTSFERLVLADELDAILEPIFATRTTAEWVAGGDARRIPITPMLTPAELPKAEHWRAWGAFAPFDDSGVLAPALPFKQRFDGVAASLPRTGPLPLSGLRVVDFSMGWAGPLCTRTLADLGAEVIKIESQSHPDWWRGWEEVADADPPPMEVKHNFITVNRNKRGVCLELTTPEGLAAAKALIARADVMVENYGAGVMDKLGLGADVRRAVRPGLISVTMPAFGSGGPLSNIRAYGSTVEQASGLPFVNGHAHWPPSLQHVAYGDPLAGLFAAASVLSALYGRERLGGAEIDLAQVACLFQFGADATIAWQLAAAPPPRTGSRRARYGPVCVVPALEEDTWLAVAVQDDAAWRGLCAVLGRPDGDLTADRRAAAAEAIEAALAEWAMAWMADEAAGQLQAAGVAAAPVRPAQDLTYDLQLEAAEFWPFMERRYVGRHRIGAAPFVFDGVRPPLRLPAPTLGEHTDEVLAEL